MELFYARPENIGTDEIKLDEFEKKHLLKTLRKKSGDIIDVTDGLGRHFTAEIISVKPELSLKIISSESGKIKNRAMSLGVAFIRLKRLEFIIEKGTELGVSEFILFKSRYCNFFTNNSGRFEKIARQAMKQSLQFYLPKITIIDNFDKFIDYTKEIKFKIAGYTEKDQPIKNYMTTLDNMDDAVIFVVGPEGGFSEEEGDIFKNNRFRLVSLGKTRLRTETAAIGGAAMIQFYRNS